MDIFQHAISRKGLIGVEDFHQISDFDVSKNRMKPAADMDFHYAEILGRWRGWLAGYAVMNPL
ncbi:hypothetical protein [Gimesia sp.]|uniref:hypothetical protein n=1 Tax=Gimesia sp. TaxID=2024833 RepID=UPI003A9474BE